jgi:transcriptional regulator with XRE-family HTH domain
MDNHKTSVASRIETALNIRGLRPVDLSEKTCLAKGTISNYIKGKYIPKTSAISKIAKALNVSDMWLMGFDVPMERYANSPDADFLDMLPTLKDKESLPPMLEAVNTLLYESGRQIMKVNNEYFLDECGQLSADEINDLINNIVISAKNAVDSLLAKKTKEVRDYLSKK